MVTCTFAEKTDRTTRESGTFECVDSNCKSQTHTWSAERPIYRLTDGREIVGTADLPPGTLFFADSCWSAIHEPPCSQHLQAVCPNGTHWDIDSRANNCGRPEDKTHRCWVRHGDPREPSTVHVDKNGDTCSAGAGSIIAGDYHGYLHNGVFSDPL